MVGELAFVAGALMAAAGSLHCAGQCGTISASLALATHGPSSVRSLATIQGGRVAIYVAFGALLGLCSQGFDIVASLSGLSQVMRILAAANLVWVGASVAGLGPRLMQLDPMIAGLSRAVRAAIPAKVAGASPLALGLAWGFAPCAMVYAALVNAMLSGSWWSGMCFMAGFGLATVPAVAGAAYGMATLVLTGRHDRYQHVSRRAIGTMIALLGVGSLWLPAPGSPGLFCLGG